MNATHRATVPPILQASAASGSTLGADKAYDVASFVVEQVWGSMKKVGLLRKLPHRGANLVGWVLARVDDCQRQGVDPPLGEARRTAGHEGAEHASLCVLMRRFSSRCGASLTRAVLSPCSCSQRQNAFMALSHVLHDTGRTPRSRR